VSDLEIGELFEICEFKITDAPDSLSDGFIERDDSAVDTGMRDSEEVDDIFSIAGEFMHSVGKSESRGPNGPIPGDVPITSVLDDFSWFNGPVRDFKISEFLHFGIVLGSRELSTEDSVEVDRFSR
jgi:hypothetical protein